VPLSLAATLLLAVGGVFIFGLNDRVEALAASLAIDHVKCFKTVKTDPNTPADTAAAAIKWKQDRAGDPCRAALEPSNSLAAAVRRRFSTEGRGAT
jgi:hypothetical protein